MNTALYTVTMCRYALHTHTHTRSEVTFRNVDDTRHTEEDEDEDDDEEVMCMCACMCVCGTLIKLNTLYAGGAHALCNTVVYDVYLV